MASVPVNPTQITPPRVDFLDARTGAISREWYRFLLSLRDSAQTSQDASTLSPDANALAASYSQMIDTLAQATGSQATGASVDDVAVVQNQVQDLNAALPPDLQTYLQPVWSSLQDLSLAPSASIIINNTSSFVSASGLFAIDDGTASASGVFLFDDGAA